MKKKIEPSKCQHEKAVETGRSAEDVFGRKIYLTHFYCSACGTFFAREIRGVAV